MGNKLKLVIGIILMAGGIGGATLDISTRWHYFGNGVLFGVGLVLFIVSLKSLGAKTASRRN